MERTNFIWLIGTMLPCVLCAYVCCCLSSCPLEQEGLGVPANISSLLIWAFTFWRFVMWRRMLIVDCCWRTVSTCMLTYQCWDGTEMCCDFLNDSCILQEIKNQTCSLFIRWESWDCSASRREGCRENLLWPLQGACKRDGDKLFSGLLR